MQALVQAQAADRHPFPLPPLACLPAPGPAAAGSEPAQPGAHGAGAAGSCGPDSAAGPQRSPARSEDVGGAEIVGGADSTAAGGARPRVVRPGHVRGVTRCGSTRSRGLGKDAGIHVPHGAEEPRSGEPHGCEGWGNPCAPRAPTRISHLGSAVPAPSEKACNLMRLAATSKPASSPAFRLHGGAPAGTGCCSRVAVWSKLRRACALVHGFCVVC